MKSADDINHDEIIPMDFHLSQNYPNPFNIKTTIKYCVGYRSKVKIIVFNADDKIVEKLVDEEKDGGTYEIDFFRNELTPGIYYYRMTAGNYSETKTIQVL
jgi:hypothetical protein